MHINLILFILFWIIVKDVPQNLTDLAFLLCCTGFLFILLKKYNLLPQFKLRITFLFSLIKYISLLVKDIFFSTISVTRIIWNQNIPTSSSFVVIKANKNNSEAINALVANYITLTPGTYTISIDDNNFLINCLSQDDAISIGKSFEEIQKRTTELMRLA